MQNHETHNSYYHNLITDYKRHFIAFTILVILAASAWESYSQYQKNQQVEVQKTYEAFISNKNMSLVHHMQQSYPNAVQSHLAALYKAKVQYEQKSYEKCIGTLKWVLSQETIKPIRHLTESRLMSVYYELDNDLEANALHSDHTLSHLISAQAQQNIEPYLSRLMQSQDPKVQLFTQYLQLEQQP
ncbi:tetratricopeptide repeat protein [Gammaproteobacteria bacterium]|nr:tetratricopeptide repeat protein [Gammaproteobacteria bacterium]